LNRARRRKVATAAIATTDRFRPSRKPPSPAPAFHHLCKRRQIRPQRHPRRAGQGPQIDQKLWLFLAGERKRVGQHQPALGIGISDLYGQALARGEDVERAECVAGDRVLHRGNQDPQAYLELGVHHHLRQRQHVGGPAISFFMISMPLDGLRSSPPASKQTPLPTSVTLG